MDTNAHAASFLRSHSGIRVRCGPSGVHIFARNTGANILIDEIVPPESMWAAAPRQVSIALTNACDLACAYCYAPKTNATLSFDRIVSWLNELDANGTIGVGFGGGEPTLHRLFPEICAHTAAKTGLAVTFTTHAHRLSDELLSRLDGSVHFVRISMDGVYTTYERLRGRSFAALESRLDSIRRIMSFGINYVINADTFPDIDLAATLAEETGASEFLLLPELPVGYRPGITDATSRGLREWVSHYRGCVRIAVSEQSADGMPICRPYGNDIGLRAYAHIDAHGVLKSTSHAKNGVPIGPGGVLEALTTLTRQSDTAS